MDQNLRTMLEKTDPTTDHLLHSLLFDDGIIIRRHEPLLAQSSIEMDYDGPMSSCYSSSVSSLTSQYSMSLSDFEQSSESQDDIYLDGVPYRSSFINMISLLSLIQ